MRLLDLEPQFLKHENSRSFLHVDNIYAADGVMFVCPSCFRKKGGRIGVHSVICWSPSVSQDTKPAPGRWEMRGTGYEDLSLVAGSSSVHVGGCGAHFLIVNGEIKDC